MEDIWYKIPRLFISISFLCLCNFFSCKWYSTTLHDAIYVSKYVKIFNLTFLENKKKKKIFQKFLAFFLNEKQIINFHEKQVISILKYPF